jgi:hypothetical protein
MKSYTFLIVGLLLGSLFGALIHNVNASYGDIGQNVIVDKQVIKDFLKDNFKWQLMASDGGTWYNADSLMSIGINWRDSDNSYKVTLTLNTNDAPRSLYYRFDLAFEKTVLDYMEVDGWRWDIKVNEYDVFFDWSDIKELVNTSKVTFDKGVTNNFFWFRIQTVNKINPGLVFVVDPSYGVITSSVVSTYEYDPAYSLQYNKESLVRVNNSNYYLLNSLGTGTSTNDGVLRTLYVNPDTGIITAGVVSTYDYDTGAVQYPGVLHIANTDKYLVVYRDDTTSKTVLKTVQVWDTNGTIKQSAKDTQALTYKGEMISFMVVTSNVYAIAYQETISSDGFLETVWIDSSGVINNSLLDIEEFDTTYCGSPDIALIDSNTIAVTYVSVGASGDLALMTYNISSSGIITDDPASSWTYELSPYNYPLITKVGNNVYALTYMDSVFDVWTKTVAIADSGKITQSSIDTLEIVETVESYNLVVFTIHDSNTASDGKGIMGVTMVGVGSGEEDGYLYTWNVTSSGGLDSAKISSYEYETTIQSAWCPAIWVNKSFYLLIHGGSGNDGYAKTLFIKTNWATPTVSSVAPVNYAVGVSLTPKCNITVSDSNGDSLNILWESYVGSSWVSRQVNNSVGNGTYRWRNTDATSYNTMYSWRVSVSDGFHNTSYVYVFTTLTPSYEIIFGACIPVNHSLNVALSGTFCILINETGGNSFNYSIELSNGQTVSANGVYNGTRCLTFNLLCDTNYTVWVNASNRYDSNSSKFWFNTVECVYCTNQTYNYTNLSVYWWVDLSSDNGTFNWSIECSNGQNVSGIWDANGTYGIFLYNLSYNTTYIIWVNCSTHLCGTNDSYILSFGSGVSASNLFINNDRFTLGLVLGTVTFLFAGMVIWRRRKDER